MKTCQQCGKSLDAAVGHGLCPECMLKVGLGSGADTIGSTKPPGAAPDLAEIAKHFPQLEILEFLGAGGGGPVYKARQKQLDRVIALKILPSETGRDPAFAERFLREARALAKLNHPNIVAVYEFGEIDGLFFLIMEYVDGANLRHMERAGQLTPAEALTIVPKICDALQYAHDEGVVHRDIKPENILVDKKGRVKIADFGLAKLLGKAMEDFSLTRSHQMMGTPVYMAPEQVEKPLTVDHRADIYSLGVVFYEMLTGELPMGRFALPSQTLHVDVRLDEVVLKSLEKEPDRRYQHVSEVKTAVEDVTSHAAPAPPKRKYRPAAMILAGLGVVLIAALAWWFSARTVGKSSVSALAWRTTLTQAETAYDENRIEEAIGLFDAALAAMDADQKADPTVLKATRDKARKDRSLAGFILDRSKLPLPQQIESTQQKLAEYNTNYTGKGVFTATKEGQIITASWLDKGEQRAGTFTVTKEGQIIANLKQTGIADLSPLKGLPLVELNLDSTPVADLSPLRGMKLAVLYLVWSQVVDLAPLKGMPLRIAEIGGNKNLSDLSPLQGMPLGYLNIGATSVRDLRPLKGMPLVELFLGQTPVSDLRPLQGMALKTLWVNDCQNLTDISTLQGMPLVELHAEGAPVADLSPLRTLKSLTVYYGIDPKPLLNDLYTALRTNGLAQAKQEAAALIADCQSVPAFSNVVAEAREIQAALAQLEQGDTGPYSQYWLKHLNERGIIAANRDYGCDTNGLLTVYIRGPLSSNVTLDALQYAPLKRAEIRGSNLTNLQALAGLPLTSLGIPENPLTDLSPLRGMKLDALDLYSTSVADLTPLKGMPLTFLDLRKSKVVDLSPLKGMPLKTLLLAETKVVDLSPLKGMSTLTELDCGSTAIRDIDALQGTPLKTLRLSGCMNLTSVVIPDSLTSIGNEAFTTCANLTHVTIPNSVTNISRCAFSVCTSLTSITIPNSVATIGDAAFWGCTGLTNVAIPSSVTSMQMNPFDSCSGLLTIRVDAANAAYCSSADGVLFDKKMTRLISYPGGRSGSYVVPNGVTTIGKAAFVASPGRLTNTRLTSLTIPESVTSIEVLAFCRCMGLTSVYFKGNAPSLEDGVFTDANNVTVYYLPGTTGWGKEFGGRPTAVWNPQTTNDGSPAVPLNSLQPAPAK